MLARSSPAIRPTHLLGFRQPDPRGPLASRLGLRDIDNDDARHRIKQLALSLQLEETTRSA